MKTIFYEVLSMDDKTVNVKALKGRKKNIFTLSINQVQFLGFNKLYCTIL